MSPRIGLVAWLALLAGCGTGPAGPTPPSGAAPTLACPGSITISDVTTATVPVVYAKATLAGGSVPVTVSCTPAQGFAFPVGSTSVTCAAVDVSSRRATCAFTVTLVPRLVLGVEKILAFGDSITEGQDGRAADLRFAIVNPATAYPTVLQSLMIADFPHQGIAVTNAGKGGEAVSCDPIPPPTETCGVMRLPGLLQQLRPQALLLLEGYNDLGAGVSAVGKVVEALRLSVRSAKLSGVQFPFVSTITPGRPATGPNNRTRSPQAILLTNQGIVAMAAAEGASLVDAYGAFVGKEALLVADDGLHLNAAGYRVLAETFYRRIREVIPATPVIPK